MSQSVTPCTREGHRAGHLSPWGPALLPRLLPSSRAGTRRLLCNTHQQSASSTQKHRQGQPLATMKLPNHLRCSSYEARTTHRDEQGPENSFHIKSSGAPAAHTVKVHSIQTDLAAACYDDIHFSKVRAEEKLPEGDLLKHFRCIKINNYLQFYQRTHKQNISSREAIQNWQSTPSFEQCSGDASTLCFLFKCWAA